MARTGPPHLILPAPCFGLSTSGQTCLLQLWQVKRELEQLPPSPAPTPGDCSFAGSPTCPPASSAARETCSGGNGPRDHAISSPASRTCRHQQEQKVCGPSESSRAPATSGGHAASTSPDQAEPPPPAPHPHRPAGPGQPSARPDPWACGPPGETGPRHGAPPAHAGVAQPWGGDATSCLGRGSESAAAGRATARVPARGREAAEAEVEATECRAGRMDVGTAAREHLQVVASRRRPAACAAGRTAGGGLVARPAAGGGGGRGRVGPGGRGGRGPGSGTAPFGGIWLNDSDEIRCCRGADGGHIDLTGLGDADQGGADRVRGYAEGGGARGWGDEESGIIRVPGAGRCGPGQVR